MDKELILKVASKLYSIFADIKWIQENGLDVLDVPDELMINSLHTDIALCAARTISKLKEEK